MLPYLGRLNKINTSFLYTLRRVFSQLSRWSVPISPSALLSTHHSHGICTEVFSIDAQASQDAIGIRSEMNGGTQLAYKLRLLKNLMLQLVILVLSIEK